MANNVDEQKLKNDIENFVEQKGWPGFFGLLATISPQKVDPSDLEKYQADLSDYEEIIKNPEALKFETTAFDKDISHASIYSEEHLEAVREDLKEQGEQQKKRVLEQPTITAPNPWGDAVTVSPGQLKL